MEFAADYRMLIGGRLVRTGRCIDVLNPATERVIAQAPDASPELLDKAVAAARAAFPDWAATPIQERRLVLQRIADTIETNAGQLKSLLTAEQGKPLADAEAEILRAAAWLKGVCDLDLPVRINADSGDRYSETHRVPLGVVGAITPWNFPVLLVAFKIGPALLAGNTVVLKPSPFTPLTTLRIGELVAELIPPGVLNIVSGGDLVGPWITAHPGIDKISFTGSSATGRKVMESASGTLKRLTLELGGNDPAIVLPDADAEAIAEPLFWSAFRNSGQVCIATKRLYIHKDVFGRVRDALVGYAQTVRMGDGADPLTRLGPLNNVQQYLRVRGLIDDARHNGFSFLTGGEEVSDDPGYFVPVTLLDRPPEDSRIVQAEQFGPVLPLLEFSDIDDVLRRANATELGLGASIWGSDEDRAMEVALKIDSGTVWLNQIGHHLPTEAFGGIKQSGLGIESGLEGLLEHTTPRTLVRRTKPQRGLHIGPVPTATTLHP